MSQRDDELTLSRMGMTSQRYSLTAGRVTSTFGLPVTAPATGITVTATVGREVKTLRIDPDLWEVLKPLFEELHTRRRP
tara:strand:- start:124 stop:360 length:237 start_codon:yes stop_codon:yes gene_type:complete